MNLSLAQRSFIAALSLSFTHFTTAHNRGVIDGPDECANVHAEERSDAPLVGNLKTGEPFTFESKEADEWCKVTLASKKLGWMQCSCIRLFFTKKDWPQGTPTEIAPTFGQEYYKVMRRAESGDKEALKKFFGFGEKLDGAAAEEDAAVLPRVIHILGDARFADFLRDESPAHQAGIKAAFISSLADAGAPLEGAEYIRRHFPKTAEIFSQVRDPSVSASEGPSNNSTASPISTPESQPGKSAIGENDFPMFWKKFKSAVIAGDRATVAEITKFPLSMPYLVKAVKNKEDFLRRYNEIFKGEANAGQCFASAEPQQQSTRQYEVYCPFKDTPNDWENVPIRFIFESTKSGWKFAGLDNINE